MRPISENDNGSLVEIRQGEPLQISLAENATTGYRWEIDRYDEDRIEALSSDSSYPNSGVVGSGGRAIFTFQGKRAGYGEIVLKHRRSWEKDQPPLAEFRIRVQVLAS